MCFLYLNLITLTQTQKVGVIVTSIFQMRNKCFDGLGHVHSHKAYSTSKAKFIWSKMLTLFHHSEPQYSLSLSVMVTGGYHFGFLGKGHRCPRVRRVVAMVHWHMLQKKKQQGTTPALPQVPLLSVPIPFKHPASIFTSTQAGGKEKHQGCFLLLMDPGNSRRRDLDTNYFSLHPCI